MTNVLDDLNLDEELVRYTALLAQIKALQEQADAMRTDAEARARSAIRSLMEQHDLSLEDVEEPAPRRRAAYGSKKKARAAAAASPRIH